MNKGPRCMWSSRLQDRGEFIPSEAGRGGNAFGAPTEKGESARSDCKCCKTNYIFEQEKQSYCKDRNFEKPHFPPNKNKYQNRLIIRLPELFRLPSPLLVLLPLRTVSR